jgi:hypothetical protein
MANLSHITRCGLLGIEWVPFWHERFFFGEFRQEGRLKPITTKISQETLAEIVGTTRPRVSFIMNKFRKLGFIEYDRDLTVQHRSRNDVALS